MISILSPNATVTLLKSSRIPVTATTVSSLAEGYELWHLRRTCPGLVHGSLDINCLCFVGDVFEVRHFLDLGLHF